MAPKGQAVCWAALVAAGVGKGPGAGAALAALAGIQAPGGGCHARRTDGRLCVCGPAKAGLVSRWESRMGLVGGGAAWSPLWEPARADSFQVGAPSVSQH